MAEVVGLASGLLTLAVFALQASTSLYSTVQSFQSHNKRVRDLLDELEALSDVLQPLSETIENTSDTKLSLLDRPLLRCGKACNEFEQELLSCLSRCGGGRTSFRDWAKLQYMGDDIDGFRRLLAGYKLTICIALTDANLHKTNATAEKLEEYKDLIRDATDDLQTRLELIDEKLNSVVGHRVTESSSDATALEVVREERLSTQKCLEICNQLSRHINEMQLTLKRHSGNPEDLNSGSIPDHFTDQGLKACKADLADTVKKLENHMKDVTNRLMINLQTAAASKDELAELVRLRDQWEASRQCLEICSKADDHLKRDISVIDNSASGDAVQFMVSTSGKVLHGKNRGTGWRTRQVGGYLSDITVQQLSRDMSAVHLQRNVRPQDSDLSVLDDRKEHGEGADFKERHGRGVRLKSSPPAELTTPAVVTSRND